MELNEVMASLHSILVADPDRFSPLIICEGPDGSGKTTLCNHLSEWLMNENVPNEVFANPPRFGTGGKIYKFIIDNINELSSKEISLLMIATRETLITAIKDSITQGKWIIVDRWYASFIVYNILNTGMGKSAPEFAEAVAKINYGLSPLIQLVLSVPDNVLVERFKDRHNDTGVTENNQNIRKIYNKTFLDIKKNAVPHIPGISVYASRWLIEPEKLLNGNQDIYDRLGWAFRKLLTAYSEIPTVFDCQKPGIIPAKDTFIHDYDSSIKN